MVECFLACLAKTLNRFAFYGDSLVEARVLPDGQFLFYRTAKPEPDGHGGWSRKRWRLLPRLP